MHCVKQCVQRFASTNVFTANNANCLSGTLKLFNGIPCSNVRNDSTSAIDKGHFLSYNDVIFPPQKPGEEKRPGFVCHLKSNVKYSPQKMWYIASLVRGMTADEAVKQLSFLHKKGAAIVKEVILEAQEMAVQKHNIEFKSNLWVAESFATKGMVIKGLRRHAKGRKGDVRYKFCHYFVRLEEGKPPKNYYVRDSTDGDVMLQDWMDQMHRRKIHGSL